jgi:hypothetical protein
MCCGWRTPPTAHSNKLYVHTVVCAPYDEWKYHLKHAEQFPDINKLCNVASCWINVGIYLRCTNPQTLNLLIILVNGRWDLTRRLKFNQVNVMKLLCQHQSLVHHDILSCPDFLNFVILSYENFRVVTSPLFCLARVDLVRS